MARNSNIPLLFTGVHGRKINDNHVFNQVLRYSNHCKYFFSKSKIGTAVSGLKDH
jgi:transposase